MNHSLLEKLNPEQQRAVITTKGRVLVLAGAGTGKTRVLTYRIAHLIHQGVSPSSILGVTFTNKAAREMQSRMAELIPPATAKKVTLSTFHSFCMKILRTEIHHLGYTKSFTLYTESEMERLIESLAKDLLDDPNNLPPMKEAKRAIYFAKQKGIEPNEWEANGWHDTFAKNLYEKLLISMRAYNAVDFDHLLFLTVKLFREHPTILEKYQAQFQYIMIDEYQDTNPVQFELAEMLTKNHQNFCVVGDDDQSIYGWRGADIQNILQFKDATVIKLEQNYRSTTSILSSAHAVISINKKRHDKKVWSALGEGEKITLFHAPDEMKEAEAVIYRIIQMKEKHRLKWKDIAILYRSNALSRSFETALLSARWYNGHHFIRGIPYQIFGGTEFYERKEVKDLVAYLRAIANPRDEEALLRVINYPRRGIGEKSLDQVTSYQRTSNDTLWNTLCNHTNASGITQFVHLIQTAKEKLSENGIAETIRYLVEATDLKKTLKNETKKARTLEDRYENIDQLINAAASFEETNSDLGDFLSQMTLNDTSKFTSSKKDRDAVQLMTFHSAKGLEFPACFLCCLEEGILPHDRSIKEGSSEEERRLFYVGITRAKRYLTLSMAKTRRKMGKTIVCKPSPFLYDLPKELLQIETWNTTIPKNLQD